MGGERSGNSYRDEIYSFQILLSRTQAGPGRTVKQEQEDISPNHVQRINLISVVRLEKRKNISNCGKAFGESNFIMLVLNDFPLARIRWWIDVTVASRAPLAPRDEAGETLVVRRGLEFLATPRAKCRRLTCLLRKSEEESWYLPAP